MRVCIFGELQQAFFCAADQLHTQQCRPEREGFSEYTTNLLPLENKSISHFFVSTLLSKEVYSFSAKCSVSQYMQCGCLCTLIVVIE